MISLDQVVGAFPVLAKLGVRGDAIPLVHQTTATDCGAACLAMVLAHHGRHVSLEEVRSGMAVGRDGVTARAIVETASTYGLAGRGVTIGVADLSRLPRATILFLGFAHFVVLDNVDERGLHVVDPACGRRTISLEEAHRTFTGVALLFEKSLHFARTAKPANPVYRHLKLALSGSREFARIALVSVLLQLVSLLFPLLEGRIADRVLPRNDLHLLFVLLCGLATTVVFYLVASITRSQLLLYLRTRFDARLTLGFVEHMLRLPYEFFERRQVGDLQMRVGSVTTVREALTGVVLSGLIDGVLVVSHLVFLVMMSVKMTLVALAVVLVQVILYLASQRKMMELAGGSIAKQAESANALNELLVGIESLKASGCEQAASQHWASKYVDVMNVNLRRGHYASFFESIVSALNVIGPMALLVAGATDVLERKISLGTMLSANAMAVGFIHPVMNLVGTLQSLITIRAHLGRIDDVLASPPEHAGTRRLGETIASEIVLDRVSFRYGPRLPPVVKEVSLRIRPGECVAIVGSSGSGKTTLGRLLLGLYGPTSGTVSFDGTRLADLDLRSVRRRVGVVVQRPHVFGNTVRANIALADPAVSLEQVRAAAALACIEADIERMPMRFDTILVAGGTSLSGGQRQRLALARALVHRPSVLLLDEATSALDAVTEQAVQRNLERLPCTRILIAHRLSTVRNADRILVMEEGALVEEGTHAELLAKGGVYARLVAAQLGTSAPEARVRPPMPSGAVVHSIGIVATRARARPEPGPRPRAQKAVDLDLIVAAGAPFADADFEARTTFYQPNRRMR
jgi:ATP-binding cassette, subfamily B, bacterial